MIPISLEGPSILCVKIKSAFDAKSYENTKMCLGIQMLYTIIVIQESCTKCTIKIRINCPWISFAFSFTLKYAM